MRIIEQICEPWVVLRLSGEICGIESVQLLRKVEDYGAGRRRHIVIDLSEVDRVDTTTVGGFIYLCSMMKKAGVELVFRAPRALSRKLFGTFKLEGILDTVENIPHRSIVHTKGVS